jgi:hypothetical protein
MLQGKGKYYGNIEKCFISSGKVEKIHNYFAGFT